VEWWQLQTGAGSGKAQGRQRKESRWRKEHLDPWHNVENAAITLQIQYQCEHSRQLSHFGLTSPNG
jgi:hypothetical protein